MADLPVFTYQTRLGPAREAGRTLAAFADLYGRAERSLFAAMRAGGDRNQIKREFLSRFGITSRQFNAIRIGLEGKISSIVEMRDLHITELRQRIKKATHVIKNLQDRLGREKKQGNKDKLRQSLHGKKRRLAALQDKAERLKTEHAAGIVRLCFGSRKLFNAQYHLQENGYRDHSAWKKDWQKSRQRQFFVLGSKDETAGNQTCVATIADDGSLSLQLRLPDALVPQHGKHLRFDGVRFTYGHESVVAALRASRKIDVTRPDGKTATVLTGQAIGYRFVCDEAGWRVFATVTAQPVKTQTTLLIGAVGVDINADHLAIAEVDRFGNPVGTRRFDLHLQGKTSDQREAIIGDAVRDLVQWARQAGKPVILEDLDFKKKKAALESVDARQARMLSSFAYNKIKTMITSASHRAGVEVITVDPAYTSVIGAVNHAQQRGISIHQGAAIALARRGMKLSEHPSVRLGLVPSRNGAFVAFSLPARIAGKHVEATYWKEVKKRLQAAQTEHYRSRRHLVRPPPLDQFIDSLGASGKTGVRVPGANRSSHCSGDVMGDIPF